jgi:hypothetical protein
MGKIVSKCINPPCDCFGRDVIPRHAQHEIILLPEVPQVYPRLRPHEVEVPEIIRVSHEGRHRLRPRYGVPEVEVPQVSHEVELYTPIKYYIKSTVVYRGQIL